MHSVTSLRRVALLLALLPQVLSLGLGRTVVLCIAPGGHSRLELAASACCGHPGLSTTAAVRPTVSSSDDDCGSCSDYGTVQDPRLSLRQGTDRLQLPQDLAQAVPVGTLDLHGTQGPAPSAGQSWDSRQARPSHLSHQRSIVLRC